MRTSVKHKTLIALLLLLSFCLPLFAGCGSTDEASKDSESGAKQETVGESGESAAPADQETEKTEETEDDDTEADEPVVRSVTEGLTAVKIGEIDENKKNVEAYDSAIIYESGDKYGVLSPNGKKDSGAIFDYCEYDDGCIIVSDKHSDENIEDMATLNVYGAVGINTELIVPMNYAYISRINKRYYEVITVDGITESKDECLIYFTDSMFSIGTPGSKDTMLKGKWAIYDTVNKTEVKGVTGNRTPYLSVLGPYIRANRIIYDCSGEKIETSTLKYSDLDYYKEYCSVENTGEAKVLDYKGNTVFTYDPTQYSIVNETGDGCFIGRNKKDQGGFEYFVVDGKGNVISAPFDNISKCLGKYIYVYGKGIYDLNGNPVLEREVSGFAMDPVTRAIWIVEGYKDKYYAVIDEEGNVKVISEGSEDVRVDSAGDTLIIKKKNGSLNNDYYSFKDNDFSVNSDDWFFTVPLVIEISTGNGSYGLQDLRNNNVLISGYKFIRNNNAGGVYYVYAKKAEGGFDIFKLS